MFLLFSRPIEFLGMFSFLYVVIGFLIISIISGVLLPIFLSKDKEIKAWIAGFAVMGAIFLVANLVLAVPIIIFLFLIQASVLDPIFGASDETFHKIDKIVTISLIILNLIFYFLAVKKYRRKIYSRIFEQ